MRGFCERQPDACVVGSQAATTIGYRLQAGAKMLYEFLNEQLGPNETATGTVAVDATHAPGRTPFATDADAGGSRNCLARPATPQRSTRAFRRTLSISDLWF